MLHFLFAPGMACLRPMSNQVKLPFLGGLLLLPTVLLSLLEPAPTVNGLAIGLFLLACYFVFHRQIQGAAFCIFFFFQQFLPIATYMADAIATTIAKPAKGAKR